MKLEVERRMRAMGVSSVHNEDEPLPSSGNANANDNNSGSSSNEEDTAIPMIHRTDSMVAKAA